jgi:WS/DGAT/MGAT family acyltransferase
LSDFAYSRLSELDRSFLIYEGPSSPMHVGSVLTYEAAPLRGPDGALDIERILEYVTSLLHRMPRYRQRVEAAPLDAHPIWVDDAKFNLRYHVRHSRLPRPGDERILKRTCARILEQPLDLHKPLWELWVVEGLEGDRVALVNKVHHCMIDGIAGVDLMTVLMAPKPIDKPEPPPVWRPRPGPSALEYAGSELARGLAVPFRLAGGLSRVLSNEGGARDDLLERVRATARVVSGGLGGATPVPFNQPIGPHRRFDWLPMSLDEIDAVRGRLGGTVNDVVLAVVAGAMRRWLRKARQTDVEELAFKVMAPVSVREGHQRGALGNRVAAWFVALPLAERDRGRRFEQVRAATQRLKQRHEALGAETLTQAMEWLGSTPIALGARLVEARPPFNMVVTNVPGPPRPLYFLGSRMLEAHPMVPLMGSLGLGIALFSYARTLSWGFTADWELVPDLHELVLAVEREFAKLRELAESRAKA